MDDAGRFRALFEANFGNVRRYVHHRGVTGGRADDVVSETFLVAWRRLDDVPADDPLPWLLAVARNLWLNQRRSDRRYLALLQRLPAPEPAPPPPEPGEPGELDAIRRALSSLKPEDQEVLRLVAWDELTPTQASQLLGCDPGTLRVRLHRARQRLAAALALTQCTQRTNGNGQNPYEAQLLSEVNDDRT